MSATPLALCCAVVTFATPVAAQRDTLTPAVGFGITVPDIGLLLPLNVTPHFRLEPYVAFISQRADYPVTSDSLWQSETRIGLGLFSVMQPVEHFELYFGPRGGLLYGSTRLNGSGGLTSTSNSGWFAAAAIGGAYAPVRRLSVGGEARIQYDHTTSSGSGPASIPPALYARSWYSSGVLVVRFYP